MRTIAILGSALAILMVVSLSVLAAEQAIPAPAAKAPETAPATTPPAAQPAPSPDKAAAPAFLSAQGTDVVLLMDMSGSMKKTDPRNYRKEAARLFISLLGSEDHVGIVGFGDDAAILAPLTDATKKERPVLIQAVNRITSNARTTNITAAVKSGLEELSKSERKRRVLILMSDGKLDLGDATKEEESLKELLALLDSAGAKGIALYCIAFSDQSDTKLLNALADRTGGFFRYAAADKDIHLMFATMFEKIKAPDALELQGESFTVDKDVREAILLITKQTGTTTTLTDPAGKKISQGKKPLGNIQWFSAPAFDMITIEEPQPGAWKVKLSSQEGNKVFVLTDLKLKSSFDRNSVAVGDPIGFKTWLEKDGIVIGDKGILGQLIMTAEMKGPDGKLQAITLTPKPAPEEGFFTGEFKAMGEGDHSLRITAVSKTFNRMKELVFTAAAPPAPPQPVASAQPVPPPQPMTDMDLTVPLGIISLVLLIATVYLITQVRKYKMLRLAGAKQETGEAVSIPEAPLSPAIVPEPSPAAAQEEILPPLPELPAHETDEIPEDQRVVRLLAVIEYQKARMAELQGFREALIETRAKLSTLNQQNRKIQEGIEEVAVGSDQKDALQKFGLDFGLSNDELEMFIELLGQEETTLIQKFETWEREVIQILKGEQLPGMFASETAGSPELEARIGELEATLNDREAQLQEKAAKVAEMMIQYEDLEKEYMVLYQKHQAAGGDQPQI